MKKYDLIVLGGGPGGYVAAIKAAQLGAKVAVVERDKLGGICLNWGCMPTKTMLKSARLYREILDAQDFGIVGIENSFVKVDWNLLLKRKDSVVNRLVAGVNGLFKKNNIDLYTGEGKVNNKNEVEVNGTIITGNKLIIAWGARDFYPKIPGLEEALNTGKAINSKGALSLKEIPKDLIVIGNNNYAIEFATLFNSIGSNVVLIQETEHILPYIESEMAITLERNLKREKIKIISNSKVKSITDEGVLVEVKGEDKLFKANKYLISLGLKPNIEGLEHLGLKLNSRGFIETNEKLETNIKDIYAIGDINGKYPLAHVASAEGIVAAENIMGINSTINYNFIPQCIYTFPELASVGLTEDMAKEKGHDITVSKFPLAANGKSMAEGETLGFVKVISDNKYGEIIGAHIMSTNATDMISKYVALMQIEATVYDIAKTIHPHPTVSEIDLEAAFGAIDKPIHI